MKLQDSRIYSTENDVITAKLLIHDIIDVLMAFVVNLGNVDIQVAGAIPFDDSKDLANVILAP
jgi:hypothetical protein